jgi:hypothetical protein
MLRLLAMVQAQFVSHCIHIATHRERKFTFSGRPENSIQISRRQHGWPNLEGSRLQSKIRGGGDRRGRVLGRAPDGRETKGGGPGCSWPAGGRPRATPGWPAGGSTRVVHTVGATLPAGWWWRWMSNLLGVVRRDADLWAVAGGRPRAAGGGHGAEVASDGQGGPNVEMEVADWSWRGGSDGRWRRRCTGVTEMGAADWSWRGVGDGRWGQCWTGATGSTYQLERGGLVA